ncbi:hypothetical protein BG011_004578 [Mortierella polycephala]|uniref:Uncharacterized protein n=1 Tax=Mortierella polycephala TaxID=41804 RepID=A0A9P6PZI2_9FUNG|nr:hypothetical protein BG011_004578 [Mortierella polycephala]
MLSRLQTVPALPPVPESRSPEPSDGKLELGVQRVAARIQILELQLEKQMTIEDFMILRLPERAKATLIRLQFYLQLFRMIRDFQNLDDMLEYTNSAIEVLEFSIRKQGLKPSPYDLVSGMTTNVTPKSTTTTPTSYFFPSSSEYSRPVLPSIKKEADSGEKRKRELSPPKIASAECRVQGSIVASHNVFSADQQRSKTTLVDTAQLHTTSTSHRVSSPLAWREKKESSSSCDLDIPAPRPADSASTFFQDAPGPEKHIAQPSTVLPPLPTSAVVSSNATIYSPRPTTETILPSLKDSATPTTVSVSTTPSTSTSTSITNTTSHSAPTAITPVSNTVTDTARMHAISTLAASTTTTQAPTHESRPSIPAVPVSTSTTVMPTTEPATTSAMSILTPVISAPILTTAVSKPKVDSLVVATRATKHDTERDISASQASVLWTISPTIINNQVGINKKQQEGSKGQEQHRSEARLVHGAGANTALTNVLVHERMEEMTAQIKQLQAQITAQAKAQQERVAVQAEVLQKYMEAHTKAMQDHAEVQSKAQEAQQMERIMFSDAFSSSNNLLDKIIMKIDAWTESNQKQNAVLHESHSQNAAHLERQTTQLQVQELEQKLKFEKMHRELETRLKKEAEEDGAMYRSQLQEQRVQSLERDLEQRRLEAELMIVKARKQVLEAKMQLAEAQVERAQAKERVAQADAEKLGLLNVILAMEAQGYSPSGFAKPSKVQPVTPASSTVSVTAVIPVASASPAAATSPSDTATNAASTVVTSAAGSHEPRSL